MKFSVFCSNRSIILFVAFYLSFNLKAQEGYYYEGKFIPLYPDSTSIVMYFTEESSYKNDSSTFTSPSILQMIVSDGTEDILMASIALSESVPDIISFLMSMGIVNSDLQGYSYGYKTEGGHTIWPTKNVMFRLNSAKSIENIQETLSMYNAFFVEEKYGVYTYNLSDINNVFPLANNLYESGNVEWAEPDFYADYKLTNPLYPEQFYLNNTGQTIDGVQGTIDIDIDADKAWQVSLGAATIRVAVIDDGVEDHEDMKDANGNNRVLSGYTPSCTINCDGRPRNTGKHGQACAGIIAASHNNLGIRGIAPNVMIIPIRIFKNDGTSKSNGAIATAIGKAWDDFDADVLSNSWGGPAVSNVVADAINIARANGRNGRGTVVVVSSGNFDPGSQPAMGFPATVPGVIAVGAVNLNGGLFGYSGRGPNLDVVAPSGETGGNGNIRTTDRHGNKGYDNGNYTNTFGGTSAACPQVAGIAALLLSVDPNLTEPEVVCRIQISATDIGAAGFDNNTGFGIANAYYAIALDNMNISDEVFGGVQKYAATNTITMGPACTIQNTAPFLANVEITAGNRVIGMPGFIAQAGTFVHVSINTTGPCGAGPFKTDNNNYIFSENEQENNNDNKQNNGFFNVYPNPNSGKFTISIPTNKDGSVMVVATDVLGKQILKNVTSNPQFIVDFSDEAKGIYFIAVQTSDKIYSKKVVIH